MIGTSMNLEEEKIKLLKEVLPEVFAEGKIDFEKLKATLGEHIDFSNERYVLNWAGKSDAFRVLQSLSTKTLVPSRDESINFDKTNNIFIEGENLEVLKILQKSYFGKIKMIYIDPPYNTGNDSFIYPDKFSETLSEYQKRVGDKDEDGYMVQDSMFRKNSKENGQYHSNWLNMMMPRLYLARNLLTQDGVIFISIDDNELNNLTILLNEIFGEENFLNLITVKAKPSSGASGGGEDKRLKKNVEYLVCFTKNRDIFDKFNDVFETTDLMNYIENYKSEGKSWKYTRVLKSFGNKVHYTDTMDGAGEAIKIFKHSNVEICTISDIAKQENISEESVYLKYFEKIFRDTNAQSSIRQRVIECTDNEDGFYSIEYVPRSGRNKGQLTTLYYRGRNKDLIAWLHDVSEKSANKLIKKDVVGTLWVNFNWNNVSKEGDTQYPNGKKPINFIRRMIEMTGSVNKDDIILDFFAGSGSTAHAVIDMNLHDNGTRKSISVQLPEVISEKDKVTYYSGNEFKHINTVADVCITRLKRAISKYRVELLSKKSKSNSQMNDNDSNNEIDLGFKVFKLADSNFKQWQQIKDKNSHKLLEQMNLFVDPIAQHATTQNMIYEFLLKSGKSLNSDVKQCGDYISVNDNELILVLETINQNIVTEIIAKNPQKVIALDRLFTGNDQLKTNTCLQMKDANIEFKTV